MTDHDLRFRSATPEDAATVHGFVLLLESHVGARPEMPATVDDIRREMFGPKAVLHVEFLERNGTPVGMIGWFRVMSTWLGRAGLYLTDIVVVPGERGRGHASRLIAHMAARAAEEDAAFLKLEVDRGNDNAGAVYEKLGFRQSASDPMLLMGEALHNLARRS